MKKIEPFRDTRFDVGRQTQIINNIKKNDKIIDMLNRMHNLIEEITAQWGFSGTPPADLLIYKDSDGEEIDQYEFWDSLYKFVSNNQDYILRESKKEFQMLNILTRKSVLS